MVVILVLDTVVGVIADTARHTQSIRAQYVLVAKDLELPIWPPQNLRSDARPVIEASVRLPSVDKPGLNLQVLMGKICTLTPLKNHGVFDET